MDSTNWSTETFLPASHFKRLLGHSTRFVTNCFSGLPIPEAVLTDIIMHFFISFSLHFKNQLYNSHPFLPNLYFPISHKEPKFFSKSTPFSASTVPSSNRVPIYSPNKSIKMSRKFASSTPILGRWSLILFLKSIEHSRWWALGYSSLKALHKII